MKHTAVILTELIILGALILSGAKGKADLVQNKYIPGPSDKSCGFILRLAEEIYMPASVYAMPEKEGRGRKCVKDGALFWLPLIKYSDLNIAKKEKREEEIRTKAGKEQANRIREEADKAKEEKSKEGEEPKNKDEEELTEEGQTVATSGICAAETVLERIRDFDYLISNYYTVDSSTSIGPEQLDVDGLLARNMKIDKNSKGPKVLIFHTHSQEAFIDSAAGDPSTSIVGMGQYLCELLNEAGIETLHDSGVYDIIDGKLDRSSAYEQAAYYIRPLLDQNPSVEVVIDLHRDGVPETMHLVTEIGGKPTAKVMYFNGLSRTRENGDIGYLYNPYIQDNLAFSLQMKLASDELFPNFARKIYLRAYRYNLHMRPKSLLIEAGAQTNTVEEMRNSMEALALVLKRVLT